MFGYFKKNYEDILYNFQEWDHYNQDMKHLFNEEAITPPVKLEEAPVKLEEGLAVKVEQPGGP